MKIFHLEFAKLGDGLSGGEKCMIEIIRFTSGKEIKNIVLTTDNGRKLYEKLGLVEGKFIHYITINSEHTEKKYHFFVSYIIRLFLFIKIKKLVVNLIDKKNDVLICHSEFFPNSIPAFILSKYFSKKVLYWFHMQAPDIFKGYIGHFTKKINFPELRIIHYKFNQILYSFISKSGLVIAVNPYYEKLFKKRNHYIIKKFGGGIDGNICKNNNYKYDIVFMGRFHDQKGINEIPDILRHLKKGRRDIKMLIIGGGEKRIENALINEIKKYGLDENVESKGSISTNQKYDYLRQAKIFVFPSYYESFGIVILEAMSNGLPVVAYDLPVFGVFKKGIVKVPILNNVKFAREIEKLLCNNSYYAIKSHEALSFSSTFSWQKTGEEIYNLIMRL